MSPQDRERLRKMLSFANDVLTMSQGITLEKITTDKPFQYSLLYPMGQIGELAVKLEKLSRIYPKIEWADWRGFRNRVFHDYGAIDFSIVLEMVEEAIPLLITELTAALSQLNPPPPS